MKKNGYSAVEMLVVIVVLGIVTISVLTMTSNAFKDNSQNIYEETEYLIVHQAELYGKNSDTLKKEGNLVITVDDLVKAGYYMADDGNGNVIDPRNSKGNLNGLKIKLIYENEEVKASIIEEE